MIFAGPRIGVKRQRATCANFFGERFENRGEVFGFRGEIAPAGRVDDAGRVKRASLVRLTRPLEVNPFGV
jgi:hypothetical protein